MIAIIIIVVVIIVISSRSREAYVRVLSGHLNE